jgi:hypothetical protein
VSALPLTTEHDAVYPRDEQHRYRIYARRGDRLEVLACTPTPAGIGVTLVQLHNDAKQAGGRLADLGFIGVLDAVEHEWIVLPFGRKKVPLTFGPDRSLDPPKGPPDG